MSNFYNAAIDHYKAKRSEALATLELYFNNSVGIGEHSDITEAVIAELDKLAAADDRLEMLNKYFNEE